MNKLEFFKKHKIPYQLIILDNNKVVKGPTPLPKCNDSIETVINRMENQVIDSTDTIALKLSDDFMVIDLDLYEPEDKKYKGELSKEAQLWINKMKKKNPWSTSTTKKRGLHIYFKPSEDELVKLKSKARHEDTPYDQIEILSTKSFCYEVLKNKVYNNREMENTQIFKIKKNKGSLKCINKLTKKTADFTYPKWIKILTTLKAEAGEGGKEIGREWSKKSDRYLDDADYDKKWNYVDIKYSLSDNPRQTDISSSEDEARDIYLDFYDIFQGNYIINFYEGIPSSYIFDDNTNLWKCDSRSILLQVKILNLMVDHYQKILDNLSDDLEGAELGEKILKKLSKVQTINGGGIVDIAKLFILKTKQDFSENIKFDDNNHLFHFKEKDKTLDLNTLKFINREKKHYVTMTGCSLVVADDNDNEQLWKDIISSVFPNEEEKKNWLQIMINSFSGAVLEKFIVQNGGGSNGKSLLNDIFRFIHNDYAYKANVSILTKKLGDGANPAIANMSKKRFVVFDEPSEMDELEFSIIKSITGGGCVTARKLFKNEDETVMSGIKVLECNQKLKIRGRIDYSVIRRLIDVLYSSTFMLEADKPINFEELKIKTANPVYKTQEFMKANVPSLVNYLLKIMIENNWTFSSMGNIKLCKTFRKQTDLYIDDSNDIYQIILNLCDYTGNPEDFTNIKQIHYKLTESDEWENLTKKQRRELSNPKFRLSIKQNHKLKNFYHDKHNFPDDQKIGWLSHYKLKPEEKPEYEISDSDTESNDEVKTFVE